MIGTESAPKRGNAADVSTRAMTPAGALFMPHAAHLPTVATLATTIGDDARPAELEKLSDAQSGG